MTTVFYIIIVALVVYSAMSILNSDYSSTKKAGLLALVVLLPVVGAFIYMSLPQKKKPVSSSTKRPFQ